MDDVFTENLRGFEVKFRRKPGVFSPSGVDAGTRLLIDSMEIKEGTLICDLGSGGGILGFVAVRMNPKGHVHLLDDHLRSVNLAKENVELNNFWSIEVFLSDLFSAVGDRTYHQIFSNPPQQLGNDFLEELISESYKHLKSEGELWVVVKSNLKPVIERLFDKYFKNVKIVSHNKDYVVMKASRLSS